MNRRERFAEAAETLVGVPFRLFGRDSRYGLDCVGLVAAALARSGAIVSAPTGYALRNADIAPFLPFAAQAGLTPCEGRAQRGDVLLLRPGPAQHHLAIATGPDTIVHAHAALRRVVLQPLLTEPGSGSPILRAWQLPLE